MAAIAAFVIRFPSASGRCPAGTARLSDSEKMLTMLARRLPSGWGFAVIATKSPVLRSARVAAPAERAGGAAAAVAVGSGAAAGAAPPQATARIATSTSARITSGIRGRHGDGSFGSAERLSLHAADADPFDELALEREEHHGHRQRREADLQRVLRGVAQDDEREDEGVPVPLEREDRDFGPSETADPDEKGKLS